MPFLSSKLVEGRCYNLPPDLRSAQGRLPEDKDDPLPGFQRVPNRLYLVKEQSKDLFKKTHHFRWLPYIAGKVSYVCLNGLDCLTLSGTFTGCWMVIFNFRGLSYAGHIGTELGAAKILSLGLYSDPATAAYRSACMKNQIQHMKGFNPALPGFEYLTALALPGVEMTYGYITPSQELYTVVFNHEHDDAGDVRRVKKLMPMEDQGEPW
jgi:hypothetical protein